ncbi:unnamed protein product [Adineta steineri]|uniref:NHL repeat containing protein n=1 Tax=Adineta steineri TaxID=433720 RepID=A0A818PZ10_9BILA|nr:unnamed protein product [Adineta steineri]CAF3626664.1 unnamed protein product [Adineta steineri]CAF3648226.1 unnamed protein product [Adineta steineri]CAF3662803.1 unnamed protein product [Adineta steineri]
MATINIYCYAIFIILSIIVQTKSQICEKTPQYGECSTNIACGCFHMIGAKDDTGICGFLWPTCSRLVRCNSSDSSCLQPNTICVQHPQCEDFPLCYPVTMIHENICPAMKNQMNLKWKQDAITVAGGNEQGNELNQLASPIGIFIDDEKTIYIADYVNHRIVEWKFNSESGHVIVGENDQLRSPVDVVFDKQNNSLIICDRENQRVIRWFHQNQIKQQQILISDIDCYCLAIDRNGFIYVSDVSNNEVRLWKEGDDSGRTVAGGNGNGYDLNQLNTPTFIFVDEDFSLYISDSQNHRVMKWKKDAKEGLVVAGGNGNGNSLKQLSGPGGVIIDHLGQIYVADSENDRVMRWCEGNEEGEIVVGGNGKGGESDQLDRPAGLIFDAEENLYVADHMNSRVQKFLIDI